MIGQDNVSGSEELEEDVESCFTGAKLKVNHTVRSQLLDIFQTLCADMLSELGRETVGHAVLISVKIC